ncbi:hypothetical protein DER29_5665 [Micromonospora sp. M71_S20]|nr:hypothetical protein DER29_5665 [Micromonospora sp. M71_S20]
MPGLLVHLVALREEAAADQFAQHYPDAQSADLHRRFTTGCRSAPANPPAAAPVADHTFSTLIGQRNMPAYGCLSVCAHTGRYRLSGTVGPTLSA